MAAWALTIRQHLLWLPIRLAVEELDTLNSAGTTSDIKLPRVRSSRERSRQQTTYLTN